jgi:hypothetical protein
LHSDIILVVYGFQKERPASPSSERALADGIRYPWQQSILEAFLTPSESLPQKIAIAGRTIGARLADSCEPDEHERQAFKAGLRALRVLVAETKPVHREEQKKEIA